MMTTALSDAELLTQARQGDEAAFTELYVRHYAAARRLASAYPRAGDPDDLVNGAFERILGALRRGSGPDEAFRAYLFVTLRRSAMNQISRTHDEPIDEVPEPVRDEEQSPPLDPTERQLVISAYESLPERWQAVLWQTTVEGRQPRELTGVLRMSANAVAALAYRVREKLRQAYLQAHLQTAPRPQCEPHRSRLGAYVRDGLSRRDRTATEAHLDGCEACRSLVAELIDVNKLLVRSLVPLFDAVGAQVGATALADGAAALGGTSGIAGTSGGTAISGSGPTLLAKRVASKARSNPSVVAGVIAAVVGLALALIALQGGDERALPPELSPDVEDEEQEGEEEEGPQPPDSPAEVPPPPAEDEPAADARLRQPEPDSDAPSDPTSIPPTGPSAPGQPPGPAPPPSSRPSSPPAPSPAPPSTPTTTSPPAPPATPPPERPALVVVWLRVSARLQVTLTNNTGLPTDGLLVEVNVQGGALITGRPSGCGASLVLIRSASCSVGSLDPGESAVVVVPVRVTGSAQVASTRVCGSALLGLDCLGGLLGQVTTALLG